MPNWELTDKSIYKLHGFFNDIALIINYPDHIIGTNPPGSIDYHARSGNNIDFVLIHRYERTN